MKDVFVVASPFQVLSAIEAQASYKPAESVLFALTGPSSDEQMRRLLSDNAFADVRIVPLCDATRLVAPKSGRVFLGDVRDPWQRRFARECSPQKVVSLDDGNATLLVAARRARLLWRLTDRRSASLTSSRHGRVFLPGVVYDVVRPGEADFRRLEFFSIYSVIGGRQDTVVRNELTVLASRRISPLSHRGLFLGSSLVENGVMSASAYAARVKAAAGAVSDSLLYVAHRNEMDDKLRSLEQSSIEIVRPNLPIERWLAESTVAPSCIYGVLSTAFDTLRILYPTTPSRPMPPKRSEVAGKYWPVVARMIALQEQQPDPVEVTR